MSVLRSTGPIAYSLAIEPIKDLYPHRFVKIDDLGIEYSFLEALNINHRDLLGSNYAKSMRFLRPISPLKKWFFKLHRFLTKDLVVAFRHPIPKSLKKKFKR